MGRLVKGDRVSDDKTVKLRNASKLSDAEKDVIKNIQKGNPEAFKKLMKRYFRELADFAFHYVKSSQAAKDVTQDVFANIWEKRDSWHPNQSIKMYLYLSVKNEALKEIRNRKIERKYIKAYKKEQKISKFDSQEDNEFEQFKKVAQRAINELPSRARMAYKLHRRDGLTYKEIAKVMEISHKTVESQIGRALKILRSKLTSIKL